MVRLTNGNGLDPDALLDVSRLGLVRDLVGKDFGLAKGVDEGSATGSRSTWVLLDELRVGEESEERRGRCRGKVTYRRP
jgi:hypothetical protein